MDRIMVGIKWHEKSASLRYLGVAEARHLLHAGVDLFSKFKEAEDSHGLAKLEGDFGQVVLNFERKGSSVQLPLRLLNRIDTNLRQGER